MMQMRRGGAPVSSRTFAGGFVTFSRKFIHCQRGQAAGNLLQTDGSDSNFLEDAPRASRPPRKDSSSLIFAEEVVPRFQCESMKYFIARTENGRISRNSTAGIICIPGVLFFVELARCFRHEILNSFEWSCSFLHRVIFPRFSSPAVSFDQLPVYRRHCRFLSNLGVLAEWNPRGKQISSPPFPFVRRDCTINGNVRVQSK